MTVPEPFAFVIFGGSGDLARSKLLPALHQLARLGHMPSSYAVIGISRRQTSDEEYRKECEQSPLSSHLYYVSGDVHTTEMYVRLKEKLARMDKELGLGGNRLFYLAVAPDLFLPIIERLHEAGPEPGL